jgi:hypothetical protein
LHVDLKDYYPSIPHSVLLGLLVELGFPDDWLAFFGRYLALKKAKDPRPGRGEF